MYCVFNEEHFHQEGNWYWNRLPTKSASFSTQAQLDKVLNSLMYLGLLRAGVSEELVGLQSSLLNEVSYAKSQKMFMYSENKCLL